MRYYLFEFIIIVILVNGGYSAIGINLGEVSKDITPTQGIDINLAKIIEYKVEEIGDTYAIITYKTDTNTYSKIEYGLTKYNYSEQMMEIKNKREHKFILRNLKPGKTYYFKISGQTPIYAAFTTTGLLELEIEQLGITEIKDDKAVLFFRTNLPVKGKVQYYEDKTDTLLQIEWFDYVYGSRIEIKELKGGKFYNYKFECEDTYGRRVSSGWEKFLTKEKNLALNKPVYGTFTGYYNDMVGDRTEQGMLARIVDESTNYFKGIAQSNNLSDTDQWVIIDLEEVQPIRLIVVYWRRLAVPTSYRVEISEDKENWELIKDNFDASTGFLKEAQTGDQMFVNFFSCRGKQCRYIRIYVYKDAYWVKHYDWNFV